MLVNYQAFVRGDVLQKAQLRLQEVEIQTLRASLQEEQERSKGLQQDGEAQVQQLHSQLQKVQRERNDYCTKTQELQVSTCAQDKTTRKAADGDA